ncbi:hypothetical protein HDE_06974 [Halotydeus destructor]|nr:hypothetical protein HDE_06974 [Halotydeus destructor]
MIERCTSKCNLTECDSVEYTLKVTSSDVEPPALLNGTMMTKVKFFDIMAPQLETSIEEVPSMTLTTFVIFVSGLCGLWYGASFDSLRKVTATRLNYRYTNAFILSILSMTALTHCAIETAAYFEYATATETVYEKKDELFSPKLCIRYQPTTKPASLNESVIKLNTLYKNLTPNDMVIGNAEYYPILYHKYGNISLLNWYDMVDSRGKTICYEPLKLTLQASALNLVNPTYQLFRIKNKSYPNLTSSFTLASPIGGNGFEAKPKSSPMRNIAFRPIFSTIYSRLLPPPYPSHCFHYSKSNETCLNRCLRETSYRIDKKLYHSAQAFTDDARTFAVKRTHNDDVVKRECSKACKRPSCQAIFYQPDPYRELDVDKLRVTTNSTAVYLTNLVSSSIFYPMLTLCDQIIVILGTVGLWLGLSLLDLSCLGNSREKLRDTRLGRRRVVTTRFMAWTK